MVSLFHNTKANHLSLILYISYKRIVQPSHRASVAELNVESLTPYLQSCIRQMHSNKIHFSHLLSAHILVYLTLRLVSVEYWSVLISGSQEGLAKKTQKLEDLGLAKLQNPPREEKQSICLLGFTVLFQSRKYLQWWVFPNWVCFSVIIQFPFL